jgi:hypothetical protein
MFKYINVRVHILKITQLVGGGVTTLQFLHYYSRGI